MPSATHQDLSDDIYPLPYETPSKLKSLPLKLPRLQQQPLVSDIEPVISDLVSSIPSLTTAQLTSNSTPVWRDTFALTGTLRTLYGSQSILSAWSATTALRSPAGFRIVPDSTKINAFGPDGTGWIDASFTFDCTSTPATHCSGFISIIHEDGEWKIWLLRTVLEELEGLPSVDTLTPVSNEAPQMNGAYANGAASNGTSDHERTPESSSPSVLIIGGGQAGLAVASRLQALKVDYIIIDRNAHIGDNWRNRYDSAKLHTIREYSHLPMDRTFTEQDYNGREWMTKDDLAEGYARWAEKFGINHYFWARTEILSGSWDGDAKSWTVNLKKQGRDHTLTCKHIVLSTGTGGQTPVAPDLSGKDIYRGTAVHSASWKNASQFANLKGVVVGTANTAGDIADDMVLAKLSSVTMLQRSRTYVLPPEYFSRIACLTYNPTFPTELADKLSYSMPNGVTRLLAMRGLSAQAAQEAERFEKLEKAGYAVQRDGDIYWHICERLGGHYMDMGACAKIVNGDIKVIGSIPIAYTEKGLKLANGEEIEADVIVFATGFERSVKEQVAGLFGEKVAEKMGDYWGIDDEGELKGVFKRTKQDNLWYHGGTLGHARYMSRFIALQIKADLDGKRLPLFEEKF